MPSGYNPRSKSRSRSGSVGRYRYSDNRIAWANTSITKLAIMRYSDEEMKEVEKRLPGDEGEVGDTIRLMISTTSGRPYTLNLTAMTIEEFEVFRAALTLALRLSEPIIKDRDRRAAESYANGDDSFTRIYRQLPQFIVRERALDADDPGLLLGLEHLVTGPPSIDAPEGDVRGGRPRLAEPIQADRESEDDRSSTDEPESVGEVGEMGADAGGLQCSDPAEGSSPPLA